MRSNLIAVIRQKPLLTGITAIAVVFGLYVRLDGLGAWPLSVDEYYLTKAVLSILHTGLPGYECGGYYTRGLLQQYVSAIAVATMGNTELAMRIYPMVASVVMLWGVFLLGKRAGGLVVGCLALMLMSLSLWEIEFSRFARMYMPFQALAVIQVYLFIRVVIDGAEDKFKWMLLVALCGIISYEGAIFLALLPVLAILRRRSLQTPGPIVLAAGVLLLTVGYGQIPFSTLGVTRGPLPADVVAQLASTTSRTLIPYPGIGYVRALPEHPLWLGVLVAGIALVMVQTARHRQSLPVIGMVAWVATLLAFSVSLLGLGVWIYLCMTLLLLDTSQRSVARRFVYSVVVPAAIFLAVFWVAFLLLNLHMAPREIAVALLKYPNLTKAMRYSILEVVPVLMVVIAVPVAAYTTLLSVSRSRSDDVFVLLGGLALMFYIAVVMLSPPPFETRYALFIYPLLICLFSMSVTGLWAAVDRLGRFEGLLPLIVLAAFACTEDFDFDHYRNINSAEVNYRLNYPPKLQEHFKSRTDSRSAANYVNSRLKDADTVIISESEADFYLNKVSYRYKDMRLKNFPNHISCGIDHDKWSNAPVLYKREQIEELMKNPAGNIWLIEPIDRNSDWYAKMKGYEVYVAADKRTHVLEIPAGGG